MKLGITMPVRTVQLARVPEYAKLAEDAGFDTAWSSELYRNPFSMLATSAMNTSRIGLGTGIAVTGSRSPFELANEAADIDEMTGGRMRLGIGGGVAEFLGAFHSNKADKPLTRMREYVDVIRLSWQYLSTGHAPTYEGEFYQFSVPSFNPWGLRRIVRDAIPIYLAGVGPKMLELVGATADGWIGYLATPELIRDHVRPTVAEGARAAGREISDLDLMLELICVIHPDGDIALERAHKQVGFYVSHPMSQPMVEFAGVEDEVEELRAGLVAEGLLALERTSDKLVHAFSITGTPDECRDRLSEWEGIVDHLVLHTPYVPPLNAQESDNCFRNICSTYAR